MPKVVIVDDDKQTREFIRIFLEQEHFKIFEAANGAEALMVAAAQKPDIMLLDINMPVLDGFKVCEQLRQFTSMPIIMISARNNTGDRIHGLELGADDYIVKPFDIREVFARITAVLRRTAEQPEKSGAKEVHYVDLDIDFDAGTVVAFNREIKLTAKEFELLWCLAASPNETFTRNQLLQKIWGHKYYGNTRTIDTHIKRIRQRLNAPSYAKWEIITVWGTGYRFQIKED